MDVAAISGSSSTDVWVVGETTTSGYTNRQFTSVALHYNGSNWSQIPVPDGSGLVDVFSLSPSSAWAVAADGSILSWNGSAWTVLTQLSGAKLVAALSPTDVWVEGVVAIAHYNGSSWTTAPVPAGFDTPTGGAAGLTPGRVWFAGAAYLRLLRTKYGYPNMFAAYNDGPGNLEARMVDGGLLPAETINYVATITGRLNGGGAGAGWAAR